MTVSIHRDAGRIIARGDGRDLAILSRSPHGLRVAWIGTGPWSSWLELGIIEAFESWELAQ